MLCNDIQEQEQQLEDFTGEKKRREGVVVKWEGKKEGKERKGRKKEAGK